MWNSDSTEQKEMIYLSVFFSKFAIYLKQRAMYQCPAPFTEPVQREFNAPVTHVAGLFEQHRRRLRGTAAQLIKS